MTIPILTIPADEYHKVAAIARRAANPVFVCPVQVELDRYPPDSRRRDIDNSEKSLLDALTQAGVYEDDSLIHKITVTKNQPLPPDGMAIIRISDYDPATTSKPGTANTDCTAVLP